MNFPWADKSVTIMPPTGYQVGGVNVLVGLIVGIIQLLLVAAFLLAFIFLLIGGIKWIVSQGDKQAVAGAKGTITYAIIGLVLALLSFLILWVFSAFFNIDLGVGIAKPVYTDPCNGQCKKGQTCVYLDSKGYYTCQ